VGAIGQKQFGNGAPVIVIAESLKRDSPAEHYSQTQLACGLLTASETLCTRVYLTDQLGRNTLLLFLRILFFKESP
jgi:hypothetical protein